MPAIDKVGPRPYYEYDVINGCDNLQLTTSVMANTSVEDLQPLFEIEQNELYNYKCGVWSVHKKLLTVRSML